tara:strand:+ start:128 stop:448 length:321 start_codon:yes stop_codon:yes gene_type:complete
MKVRITSLILLMISLLGCEPSYQDLSQMNKQSVQLSGTIQLLGNHPFQELALKLPKGGQVFIITSAHQEELKSKLGKQHQLKGTIIVQSLANPKLNRPRIYLKLSD